MEKLGLNVVVPLISVGLDMTAAAKVLISICVVRCVLHFGLREKSIALVEGLKSQE